MDKSSLKISIITVCFNASNTIEETIISVVKQTYKNIEYIIIDGGSSDQTNNIIDKYSEFISYYCSEPDDGIYDAMNKGLEYVTGDYVLFLGADDHLISYSVIEQVCNKILLYNEEKVLNLSKEDTLLGYEKQSIITKFGTFENFIDHNNSLYRDYIADLIARKGRVD